MSAAADRDGRAELPPEWDRLEHAAEALASEVVFWRRRAEEAEGEVARLRQALESLASAPPPASPQDGEELMRLRAENTALQSRMLQARQRVRALLKRLAALELE